MIPLSRSYEYEMERLSHCYRSTLHIDYMKYEADSSVTNEARKLKSVPAVRERKIVAQVDSTAVGSCRCEARRDREPCAGYLRYINTVLWFPTISTIYGESLLRCS